jgi:hypothetical protein
MSGRLTVNCDPNLLARVEELTTKYSPYLTRHRLLRVALRFGIAALVEADPERLTQVLLLDRDEAKVG